MQRLSGGDVHRVIRVTVLENVGGCCRAHREPSGEVVGD